MAIDVEFCIAVAEKVCWDLANIQKYVRFWRFGKQPHSKRWQLFACSSSCYFYVCAIYATSVL